MSKPCGPDCRGACGRGIHEDKPVEQPPEVPFEPDDLIALSNALEREHGIPPEVPAPEEVWLIVDQLGVPLPRRSPYSVAALAKEDLDLLTRGLTVKPDWSVVRYVRADR